MEDVNPTHLALDITPNGLEWGLMRTDTGALHQVNFSGAYWTHYLLDAGPVGEDFELEVDQNGVAHVLYSRTITGEVVLLRIDEFEHDTRILLTDGDLVDAWAWTSMQITLSRWPLLPKPVQPSPST